ncbi:hypothetical protein EJ02DRAFT_240902 [Clathrospora elynae]|uniref:Uncharacterized protein n=1 Tax=Clathrospora elynae TaxID=706981 RepID=A0A6A5SJK2_9PLEO|nr:hypothetical protein EJ02DRAFT_240902 [Clathrospora elynae]
MHDSRYCKVQTAQTGPLMHLHQRPQPDRLPSVDANICVQSRERTSRRRTLTHALHPGADLGSMGKVVPEVSACSSPLCHTTTTHTTRRLPSLQHTLGVLEITFDSTITRNKATHGQGGVQHARRCPEQQLPDSRTIDAVDRPAARHQCESNCGLEEQAAEW